MEEEELTTILEKLCTFPLSLISFRSYLRPSWFGKQNPHTLRDHSPFVSFSLYLLLGTKEWVQLHPLPMNTIHSSSVNQSNQSIKIQQQGSKQENTPSPTAFTQSVHQQEHHSSRNPTATNSVSISSDTHHSAVHVIMEPEPTIASQITMIPSPCTSEIANRALQTRMTIWGTVSSVE